MSFRQQILIGLSVLLFGAAEANAACGLSVSAGNVSISWDLNYSLLAVQFTIAKTDLAACDYWLGFTKGGAASAATRRVVGPRSLSYQLYKDNARTQVLKDNSDGAITSTNEVIAGTLPAGTTSQQTLIYYLDIPSSSSLSPIAKAGTYTDTFTINAYEGADPTVGGATPVTNATVVVTVTSPYMIKLSLVPSGGSFDEAAVSQNLDFGNLAPGLTRTLDVRVRTNAGYSVTFSSAGNGKMRKAGVVAGPGVPYTLYANNVALDLSNSAITPVVGFSGTGETSLQGLAYPVRVTIGSFTPSLLAGGAVEDHILITATTTE